MKQGNTDARKMIQATVKMEGIARRLHLNKAFEIFQGNKFATLGPALIDAIGSYCELFGEGKE